ncbi:MAG TPA: glycosyltransferase [Candidatus Krumholzibacteria bacterium]|nr:glycosyltransferase [Candidatus Krumholzibacteria bacterium]HRX51242.1 glycosyltransferase [Candidatus Krumholzibacteria bacterium]
MPRTVVMAESSDIFHDYRVQKEAASLAAAGYDVVVYGFRATMSDPGDARFPFRVRTLPIVSRRFRKLRNLSIMASVAWINLLLLFLNRDFYHAHNTMFLPGMHLSARLHRSVFVYDAHEVQWEHGGAQARLEEMYIHKADGLINVSPGRVRVCSERFGIPQERFTIISNYPVVDPEHEAPAHPVGDPIRMIFSGGFDLGSNRLDLLLEAMARVEGVELNLMAFGYRDGREVMERLIARFGLEERVRFLPLVRPDEVMANVARFDVAVNLLTNPQNHVSIRYCSTNKMYEYLAAGMPVFCSDLDAFLEEMVQPGAAVAVDAESVDDIERGLRRLVEDRDQLPAMRATALRLAHERFNWSTQERNLLDLYAGLDRSAS